MYSSECLRWILHLKVHSRVLNVSFALLGGGGSRYIYFMSRCRFNHRYPICGPPFLNFFNSSLLWDIFIIYSIEQLQTLPKTQSEIDIIPFLRTQKHSSSLRIVLEDFMLLEMGLYRSRIEFLVMFEVVQHCL